MPFSSYEHILERYKYQIGLSLLGAILMGVGVFVLRTTNNLQSSEVVVLNGEDKSSSNVVIEVGGEVVNPGVYSFDSGARIDDALKAAGGLTQNADQDYVAKVINRAQVLTDGQKIYIPNQQSSFQSDNNLGVDQSTSPNVLGAGGVVVNVNIASQSKLEELWGIGPKTAQKIIEQRPYSNVSELVDKGILKQNVYDANRDLITVY